MIKITGGKFKRSKLDIISKFVRPTSSIKRESFFSVIESYGFKNSYNFYNQKIFLDLFAGVGTMGLEAISRGVDYVIFYEKNKEVIKILEKNCKKLCKNDQYEIIEEDLSNSNFELNFEHISIVYIDPPYSKFDINNLLKTLQNKIQKKTIIGVESSLNDDFEIPNKLKLIIQKKYGKGLVRFLTLS